MTGGDLLLLFLSAFFPLNKSMQMIAQNASFSIKSNRFISEWINT